MEKKKYAIHPGHIISWSDGQKHFLGPNAIAHLYRVDMRNCIVWDERKHRNKEDYIHLHPREDGNYDLPR